MSEHPQPHPDGEPRQQWVTPSCPHDGRIDAIAESHAAITRKLDRVTVVLEERLPKDLKVRFDRLEREHRFIRGVGAAALVAAIGAAITGWWNKFTGQSG